VAATQYPKCIVAKVTSLVFYAFLMALLANAATAGSARMAFNPKIYNFGILVNTNTVYLSVVMTNEGDARLEISNVVACCGSTTKLANYSVAPGETTTLDVSMPLMEMRGAVDKSLYIHSNDPSAPISRIKIAGIAVSLVDLRPERVDFGNVGSTDRIERIVEIVCLSNVLFHVTNVTSDVEAFSAVCTDADITGHHLLRISTAPPLRTGLANGKIVVRTDHVAYQRFEIPVLAHIDGATTPGSTTVVGTTANGGIAPGTQMSPAVNPILISYFFQPGCKECRAVSNEVLPELAVRCDGFYSLEWRDVGIESNYLQLVMFQERLNVRENESVCMVVDGRYALNGFKAIKDGLVRTIEKCVQEQLAGSGPTTRVVTVELPIPPGRTILEARMNSFTLPMVLIAGFLDGLNPCAISTLVFFMSLLAVAKVRGRGLLLMGLSFGLATFLTYTALGFGLLHALRLLTGFEYVRVAVETVMMVALCLLAFLSFRDAYRFRQSGKPSEITLQVPDRVKLRMHKIMRTGLAAPSLVFGGFLVGSAVTILESVCTGQLYVPTMALIIRDSGPGSGLESRAWAYLLAYNVMFVVPLAAVFVVSYFGLRTDALLRWSKQNVVVSKILLGALFLALAALMAVI